MADISFNSTASPRETSMICKFLATALLTLLVSGCIPLMVGGYIGYKIAESDEHRDWCAQHMGDASCHP